MNNYDFYSSDQAEFTNLTSSNQYAAFTEFEKRMQSRMDDVYENMGYSVDRSTADWHKDLVLTDSYGKRIKVEEKFRTGIWPDITIELLQDSAYRKPFSSKQLGWFYTSESDWLIYAMARGMDADEPRDAYLIPLSKLRAQYPQLIKNGFNHKQVMSVKGKGLTFSISFTWEDLQIVELARKIL